MYHRHVFLVQRIQLHCTLISSFVYQTYAVTLLEIFMFEMGNSIFQEIVHLFVVSFASEFILFVVVCILFLLCSCLEAPLFTTIVMTVERVFNRNLTCLNQLSNCFSPTIFL